MRTINNKKMWVKVVALTLVQTFLGWNAATAAVSDRSMWQQRGKVSQIGSSMSSNSLEQETLQKSLFAEYFVPETAGTINEFWAPKGMDKQALSSSKLLIHVRDAHCNYEAQGNIASVIDNFVKNNELAFVAVEGAEGNIDYSLLNSFPDYEVRSEVSDAFMQLGRLSGAEYANINAKQSFELFGAEKMAVYQSNLQNFRDTLTYKKEGVEFVSQIKQALNTLKENMYTPELKELEEMSSLYNNREISFVDYCQFLYNLPAAESVRGGYKNFAFLMEAIKVQELIDFSQIDTEKTELVNELARLVPREDLTTLSQATIDFRRGKLSTAKYYETLKSLAQGAKVELASYKNLRPYMLYLSVYEQIDSAELFQEKETLEAEIKRGLFKNLDQARLDKLSKNADVLEKLFSVRLTNADLSYFQDFRTDFTAWEFQNFIQEQAPKYNLTFNVDFSNDPIEKYLPKLEAFYMEAKTRDQLLVDNALAQMDLEGKNVGALVSGGFHTAGMTSYLRSKNIPYMVVTPRILKEDVNNPYLNLIGGELLPVEKILAGDFQFSLAVNINQKQTRDLIGKALAVNPTASADLKAEFEKKAKEQGIEYTIEKEGTLEGVAALIFAVSGVSYLSIAQKDEAAVRAKFADLAFQSLANVSFAQVPNTLKGAIENSAQVAFSNKSTDIVESSLDAFKGSKGQLASFLNEVINTAKGFLSTEAQNELSNVVVWSGDVNEYAYPSLSQTIQLPGDQHEIINMNNKVIVSDHTVSLAATRKQLGDNKAVTLLAGKFAHEAYEVNVLKSKKAADATDAHKQALAAVDAEALKRASVNGVTTLAALGSYLDSKNPSDQKLVDANAKLAKALDAYSKDASDANAVAAYFADVELRSISTNTTVKEILAKEDQQNLLARALAIAVPNGVAGISTVEKGLLITALGAQLGEVAGVKIPSDVFEYLKDKGVVSLVISPAISGVDNRAAIYSAALNQGVKDLTALTAGVNGAVANSYPAKEGGVIVVEAASEVNKAAVEELQAQATVAKGAPADTDKTLYIEIDTDDVEGQSVETLLVGANTVNKAMTNFKLVLTGSNVDTVKTALVKTISQDKLATEVPSGEAKVVITSKNVQSSEKVKVLRVAPVKGTKSVIRYDAALPLAAIIAGGVIAPEIQPFVSQLLTQLGVSETEKEAFLKNPGQLLNIGRTEPFNINIMSIKLAIAA